MLGKTKGKAMTKCANDTVYNVITSRITELLERGVVPWHKPWKGGGESPRNLISGKPYRGINVFLLNASCFTSPYWLTFKQAGERGGNVKRGEKGFPVVFWKWLDVEDKEAGKTKKIPLLRYYTVFNSTQCDGIEPPADNEPTREHTPVESAESIVAGMPHRPEIKTGLSRAFYSPSNDSVGMPAAEQFGTGEDYYSTLFHELTHATGHESRLNRKGVSGSEGEWSSFGSNLYAREELVAEMGAAFLCGEAGIVERTIDQSAAYVASWIQRLKDDAKLIVTAAAQAQKAADYILDRPQANESNS
jgi:antirestriction protein ArdC